MSYFIILVNIFYLVILRDDLNLLRYEFYDISFYFSRCLLYHGGIVDKYFFY